ncbi:MAG TPA: HPr(Ser) kinase/phosphatase [Candidatus Polarisedimenticolia bacterium]|nr:HPr(Ser) kinase/phosphatase [Candidatus Polarisedimenticolia bacterium]
MSQRESARPTLPVGDLLAGVLEDLDLRLVAGGSGRQRPIAAVVPQKPGLALAGQPELLRAGTVQVLGRSEVSYLGQLEPVRRRAILEQIGRIPVACFVLTHGASPHPELLEIADRLAIPVLVTPRPTARLMEVLGRVLEDRLAASVTLHGTLIDIYGVGVLILGESGVGKSESALELILRGHRLVSDDVVLVRRFGALLNGTGPEVSRYHMELRGIGIINIKDLYGVASVRERKDVELVVKLDTWREDKQYERLGLDERTHAILGVELPFLEMPVGPGRNVSILLEVAARHHLLKRKGYQPARELAGRIQEALGKKA